MSARTAAARAERGARFLDDVVGPEWPGRIDPGSLDIASPYVCICGQTFKEVSRQASFSNGFSFALAEYMEFDVLSEGHAWVKTLVAKMLGVAPSKLTDYSSIAEDVSVHLGFSADSEVSYAELDRAWLSLLKRRAEATGEVELAQRVRPALKQAEKALR